MGRIELKVVTLGIKLYGTRRRQLLSSVRLLIESLISGLSLRGIQVGLDRRTGRVTVHLDGADSEFAANLLVDRFGSAVTLNRVHNGDQLHGYLIDVGKVGYGLYVDVGISNSSRVDALIPLYSLRESLGVDRGSVRQIAKSAVLVENLPVRIEVTEVDTFHRKVTASLSKSEVSRILSWFEDDHERVIVLGADRDEVRRALIRTGHLSDIYRFEELGVFEQVLVCKRTTRASGILSAIGPLIPTTMHLFIPDEARELLPHAT